MFVDIGTARIFFDVAGSKLAIDGERMAERPTLIVMHGGPGFDHSTLRPFFDRFADTHQVLYIDHRGNGRSSGEPDTWRLDQWGDDVAAICTALGVEKPVVYGNSFGGMVAMSYASRHAEHPAKLILSSTAASLMLDVTYRMMDEKGGPEARDIAERFWTAPEPTVMEQYMNVCMPLYNPKPNPAEAAARRRAILRREVMTHFILGEMRTMNLAEGLAAITCPTLILAGGEDPITPVACAEAISAAMSPGVARLELFKDAGHGVHRDEPERAEAVLREFLA
ncbi:MAG TPA: alpha/beta hydrolase [Caulobacteraceae bacterium]|nr:alpha/beta hydrolase [Caulobacteraceae bacterium]